jgi:hypothetical protein
MNGSMDVMACLRTHMPITLLIDLLDPKGPNSARILREDPYDGGADDGWALPTTTLWSTSSSSAR